MNGLGSPFYFTFTRLKCDHSFDSSSSLANFIRAHSRDSRAIFAAVSLRSTFQTLAQQSEKSVVSQRFLDHETRTYVELRATRSRRVENTIDATFGERPRLRRRMEASVVFSN